MSCGKAVRATIAFWALVLFPAMAPAKTPQEALGEVSTVRFTQTRLDDMVKRLAWLHNVAFEISPGVDASAFMTYRTRATLRSTLRTIARRLGITYVVRRDRIVLCSGKLHAMGPTEALRARMYDRASVFFANGYLRDEIRWIARRDRIKIELLPDVDGTVKSGDFQSKGPLIIELNRALAPLGLIAKPDFDALVISHVLL